MDKDNNNITLTKTGIAWESDKKYKFQNPEVPEGYTDLADCKIFSRLESMSCGNFFALHVIVHQLLRTRTHGRKSFFANLYLYKSCKRSIFQIFWKPHC